MEKKNKTSFIFKYLIFVFLLFCITGLAIYLTINYLDKIESSEAEKEIVSDKVETSKSLSSAKDAKYGIQAYDETYNTNSLKVTTTMDVNGKIVDRDYLIDKPSALYTEYVQIDGLRDKTLQSTINEKLKQTAYNLKDSKNFVSSSVMANFSNVLSVNISVYNSQYEKVGLETLNFDLTTGNEISFEDVFVSSAPLNTYLANGLYEALAWHESENEEYEETHDMNNYDTSEYEEKFLMIADNYKKMKDNLKFSITSSCVYVYDLMDNRMIPKNLTEENNCITINFLDNIEEVAIYKRYLTENEIYDDNTLGTKDIIVLSPNIEIEDYSKILNYGKMNDNIFLEEVVSGDFATIKDTSTIFSYVQNLSDKNKETLAKRDLEGKALFFERSYNVAEEDEFYSVNIITQETTCSSEYFKELAFKDYIKMKTGPTADASLLMFDDYMKDDYPNLQIAKYKNEEMYVSKSGTFLGNSREEAMQKLQ